MTAPPLRLLFAGGRAVTDRGVVVVALSDACAALDQGRRQVRLVHGAAKGADSIAAGVWVDWVNSWPDLFVKAEAHPARKFTTPLVRNAHMIGLGADFMTTVAQRWDSGTGHAARLAREAGIPVLDAACPTALEDRPVDLRRAA